MSRRKQPPTSEPTSTSSTIPSPVSTETSTLADSTAQTCGEESVKSARGSTRRAQRVLRTPSVPSTGGTSTQDDPNELDADQADEAMDVNGALHKQIRSARISQLFRHNSAAQQAAFRASREQSLSRIDFHSAFNSGRMRDKDGKLLTLTEALQVIRSRPNDWHEDFGKWLAVKGFWSWFCRPPVVELSRMTALLVESAGDSLYRILNSDNEKIAAAQVSAARTVLELANAFPQKSTVVQVVDNAVRGLTDKQKRELIAKAAEQQQIEAPDEES